MYYVSYIVQVGDRIGLSAKLVPLPHRIDSKETVIALINALTAEAFPEGIPEEFKDGKTMPLVPLNWVLVSAQRGSAVTPPSSRPRSPRSH